MVFFKSQYFESQPRRAQDIPNNCRPRLSFEETKKELGQNIAETACSRAKCSARRILCFSSLNISSHSRAARRIFQIIAALGFRLKRQKKSLGKILPKQPVRAQDVAKNVAQDADYSVLSHNILSQ
jgi:hypothetical protein